MENTMWKLIYYVLKYIEIPETRLFIIHCIIIQLLLFRILLASVVLVTSFLKCSATCSWRLQVAIKQEVSMRNRDFKM